MQTAYLVCAVIGGTMLVIQTLLLAVGGGGEEAELDFEETVDADAAHDSFLKILSLKTVVAFLTFFGLSGLAGLRAELGSVTTLAISVAAGLIAVHVVAWLMAGLARLQSRGNLDLEKALGRTAKVYVSIPGARKAGGKVTLAVQGRMVECKAITAGAGISSGSEVRVVGLSGTDTLEVSA